MLWLLACKTPVEETVQGPLVLGGVQQCLDPLNTPSWTEAQVLPYAGQSWKDFPILNQGGALAVQDLDADGHLDILYGALEAAPIIYWSEGDGTYTPEVLSDFASGALTFRFADFNHDGRTDIAAGNWSWPSLLLNTGNREFLLSGSLPAWDGFQGTKELAPYDVDDDGDMDLYAVMSTDHNGTKDVLLRNNGGGDFVAEVIDSSGSGGLGFDGLWFDYDVDGDLDMVVVNDVGGLFGPNYLMRNDDGALSEDQLCTCNFPQATMGVDIGDINGDGLVDLLTTDAHTYRVHLGFDGPERFVETSQSAGIWDPLGDMAWGGVLADLHNDGALDLLAAQGSVWAKEDDGPFPDFEGQGAGLQFFAGSGVGTFLEQDLGFDQSGNYRAVVTIDLNADGVLDVVTSDLLEGPRMWLSDGCTTDNWIEVVAVHGSRVEVQTDLGVHTDWAMEDSSNGGAQPSEVHLGLGLATQILSIAVTSPGQETIVLEGPVGGRRRVVLGSP